MFGRGCCVLERTSRRTSAHGCPCTRICTTTSRPDEKQGPPEGTSSSMATQLSGDTRGAPIAMPVHSDWSVGDAHVAVVVTARPWLLGPQPRVWLMAT